MPSPPDSDGQQNFAFDLADLKPEDRFGRGIACSVTLHALIILLLVVALPRPIPIPPPEQILLFVNLVQLGETTAAPPSPNVAALPQEKATEAAKVDAPEAIPVPQAPSADAKQRKVEESQRKVPLTDAAKPETSATADPKKSPTPTDDLSVRLKQLAQLRQPAPPMPPKPREQQGPGLSNLSATSANAKLGVDATYSVKDFIRAQIERHWNLDIAAQASSDWVVSVHIVLNPDGSVASADVVEEARYRNNEAYAKFARNARNAVWLSSPLAMLPGSYPAVRDIVLVFNPRKVLQ